MIGSSVLARAALIAVLGASGAAVAADEPAPASATSPSASMTVHPAVTAQSGAIAQNGIGAGPLQGPLGAPGPATACCPCRTVTHVAHRMHHRAIRRAPVTVARAYVPLVPVVPYRPVYVYRPVVAYRPLVPVYAYRPFFYRPYYRPYVY